MPFCAIITCDARTGESRNLNKDLYFHKFPANPEVREIWVEMTGRDNWSPEATSVICSKHFRDTDYTIKRSGNRYLKNAAVPCEFVFYRSYIMEEAPAEPAPPSLPVAPAVPMDVETKETQKSREIVYPVQPPADIAFNQNVIDWDPFKPRITLNVPLSPGDSYCVTPRPATPVNYPYVPPSKYFPPSILNYPVLQKATAPPNYPVTLSPAELKALEEIKALFAYKYKTYSLRAVARACIAEVQEAKEINIRLMKGDMNEIQKAEALIALQMRNTMKFMAKYKRLRKLIKKVVRILKNLEASKSTPEGADATQNATNANEAPK